MKKNNIFAPINIQNAISQKLHPTVMLWNRLEGRPRTHDFKRALKAEVRDALWMLTKQWQMGEFKADDAGSPVYAKIHMSSSYLNEYQAADNAKQNYEKNIPLEVKVEQKKIPFKREEKEISIDIRLQMGKYWLKLLKKDNLDYAAKYIEKYNFVLPPNTKESDYIYAHREVWQQYAAISGRCMDGYKLYDYLKQDNSHKASDILLLANPSGDKSIIDGLGDTFRTWFESMYYQPFDEDNNAWLPDSLEYQFECSGMANNEEKTLKAKEFHNGYLDWYAFDIQQNSSNYTGQIKQDTSTFIPSHVKFEGMPDTRWWKLEDSKTSLGDIKPSTTDLAKLLLMEFGLVYANDWFLVPYTLPIATMTDVEGFTVKNNFGEITWIDAAEDSNSPWSMFKLHSARQNNTLLLAPSSIKIHDGKSLEDITLIRDEMSNMVWGIEKVVPLAVGKGDNGNEVALRVRQFHEKIVTGNAVQIDSYAAKISYLAMTDVPENWIPFVPVHVKNDNREIQLQRASMLRIIEGVAPVKIKPQTSILREGLENLDINNNPQPLPYYIHEEEVPRSGVQVLQSFRRTRWVNGEMFVWLGMKKKTGRGEGSSGLAFDQIQNT